MLLLLLPFTISKAKDFPANPIEKAGYKLDFSDEFNGPTLDREKWTDYYLPHWCKDPESAKANYRFENGSLVEYITEDQKPWCPEHDGTVRSSAIMSFDKSWIHNFSGTTDNHERNEWRGYTTKYGYFEIRAKLSNTGGGGHQAWWMVGMQDDTNDWFNSKQTGEIDILETFFSKKIHGESSHMDGMIQTSKHLGLFQKIKFHQEIQLLNIIFMQWNGLLLL